MLWLDKIAKWSLYSWQLPVQYTDVCFLILSIIMGNIQTNGSSSHSNVDFWHFRRWWWWWLPMLLFGHLDYWALSSTVEYLHSLLPRDPRLRKEGRKKKESGVKFFMEMEKEAVRSENRNINDPLWTVFQKYRYTVGTVHLQKSILVTSLPAHVLLYRYVTLHL